MNKRVPWMVKVLCGTIDVNKEPLFLRVQSALGARNMVMEIEMIFI